MQSSNLQDEPKSSGPDKVLARYWMTGKIMCIKQIAPDKILVSDYNGKTLILSTKKLTEIYSLNIGRFGANAACVYTNLLIIGNDIGVHIFDMNKACQKMEKHNF